LAARFSEHAEGRLLSRGTSREEIVKVLTNGLPDLATSGRSAKSMIFPFGKRWGVKTFEQKKVKVIFVIEGDDTLVITVYVYYGSWQ